MMNDKVNRRRRILRNHRPFSFVDLNLQIAEGAGGRFGKCVICMGSRISAGLCQMRLVFCKGVEQLFRIKQAGEGKTHWVLCELCQIGKRKFILKRTGF